MPDTSKIKEHMDVIASDGQRVGTVDHMEGNDKIKLTKDAAHGGHHHLIMVAWVDHVDQRINLNKAGKEVMQSWQHVA